MCSFFVVLSIMIPMPFFPLYRLLSLMSGEDLLKLILVYSNMEHTLFLSEAEQTSQKMVYTAALIALFSLTESQHDILCQTKQLQIGIRQPLLYQEQFEVLLNKLEKATLSPWSNWLHQVKGHQSMARLAPSDYLNRYNQRSQDSTSDIDTICQSFATAAERMQKKVTEPSVTLRIKLRKNHFFWWHRGDYWNAMTYTEEVEVKILAPYFNKKEIERVKTMAIALCQSRDNLTPAKGLYFIIAIFNRLSENQIIEIQRLVPELLKRSGHLLKNAIAPLYELLVLLAPTFYDIDKSTIIDYVTKTFSDYFYYSDFFPKYKLRQAPIILIKNLLSQMTPEQIDALYSVASDKKLQHERFYILSLLIPLLKESHIQECKQSALDHWMNDTTTYRSYNYDPIMELLVQILPYCTEEEKITLKTSWPARPIAKNNPNYLRLSYYLLRPDNESAPNSELAPYIEKYQAFLIKNINQFDWDLKPADVPIFETLLSTLSTEQITQLIRNMMSAYNTEINQEPYSSNYSMAKEHVFRIILPRLTTEQVNFTMMALILGRSEFPSVKMQIQALNIMCLFIFSHHAILSQKEIALCNQSFTADLLQPFFRFNRSSTNEAPILTALEQHRATVLKQLSSYIEQVEVHKVNYWSEPSSFNVGSQKNINFHQGFWCATEDKAKNRQRNYNLALKMRRAIYEQPGEALQILFKASSIQTLKDGIQGEYWSTDTSISKIISYANRPPLNPVIARSGYRLMR